MSDELSNSPPPLEDAWFYVKDENQCGPITGTQASELLRTNQISPDTLVWKKGLPEWIQLCSSPLAELLPEDLPPPIPRAKTSSPPNDSLRQGEDETNDQRPTQPSIASTNPSSLGWEWLLLIALLSGALAFLFPPLIIVWAIVAGIYLIVRSNK